MTFAEAMREFRANADRYQFELTQEQLEAELRREWPDPQQRAKQAQDLAGDWDAMK